MNTRIRWIAFDAVGTLLRSEPLVHEVYHRVGQKYGSSHSLQSVRRRFRRAYESAVSASPDLATSDQIERAFWRRVVSDVLEDVTDPDACFSELHEWYAQPRAWTCFPDVTETLEKLGRRGLRLVIASNYDSRLDQVCAGLEELRPIELRVISSQVGWRKPHAGFYRALCTACGADPDELLMVGDHVANDVEGALRRCRIAASRSSGGAPGGGGDATDGSAGPARLRACACSSPHRRAALMTPPRSEHPIAFRHGMGCAPGCGRPFQIAGVSAMLTA